MKREAARPQNAITMISAADVISLPVFASPAATARALSGTSSYSSRMRDSRNTS